VAYDGSADSAAAVAWAVETARLRDEPVVAVVLVDPADLSMGWQRRESTWREIEERARRALADAGAMRARVEHRADPTASTLDEVSREASMLVIGCGRARLGEASIGALSGSAARHSHCPVVVVRQARDPAADRLVVGVDGSRTSLQALEFACQHAASTGHRIHLLRANHSAACSTGQRDTAAPTSTLTEDQGSLAETVALARERYPGLALGADVVATRPGQALVDASNNAAGVVVGTGGHSAVMGTTLGAVSHHVLQRAHCPVVIVRGRA
jgi:nucleotide-binding universal stress UspA family protein